MGMLSHYDGSNERLHRKQTNKQHVNRYRWWRIQGRCFLMLFPSDSTWMDRISMGTGLAIMRMRSLRDANETKDTDRWRCWRQRWCLSVWPERVSWRGWRRVGDYDGYYYPDDPTAGSPSSDVFLKAAEPYLSKLDLDSSELRTYANGDYHRLRCIKHGLFCETALYRDVLTNFSMIWIFRWIIQR